MNSSDISGRPYDKLADTEKKKLFRNASYWAKRLEELAENQNLKGDEYVKASEKLYRKAQKSIEDKINAWYGRFAKNNDISFSEAQKRLKTDELEEFKWTVEEYIEKARQSADGSYLKELENASARVHVNRLEFMNTQLEAAARLLYNSTENGLKGLLGDIYEDTYYRSIFEIQKGYGVGASFSRLDTKLIDKVLSQPWAQDGSNFSSRVWSNKEELVRKLKTDFSQSLIRGESRDKIISRLSKDLEQDRKKTARLVHTETAALQNKAALDAYKELGVDKVRILGTLDSVTCSLCGSMDGMILPRTQLEQGVTEPPFHPNCRCTTVPYDEDWDYKGQRIAKDKDGKYYYVPETMSYEEWKREFAQGKRSFKDRHGVDEEAYNEAVQKAQQIIDKYKSLNIGDLSMSLAAEYLNTDDIAAIEAYMTSNIAYSMNYQLRNGIALSPELEEVKRSIDTALAKLPDYEGVVYRSLSKDNLDDIETFYQRHRIGETVTYSAFTSASKSIYDQSMAIQFIIKSKRGKNISDINKLEEEVLFRRESEFLVTNVNGNIFYLEEM